MTVGKWHLRSEGYMTSECDYQEITHLKANRAIEHHDRLVFAKIDNDDNIIDYRTYFTNENVGTRWHELFGTPERAVRTLVEMRQHCDCNMCDCFGCPMYNDGDCLQGTGFEDTLLEWLRTEVD